MYRQITEIGRFTRDIRHVSGIDNVFADWLSRIKENKIGTAYLRVDDEPSLTHPAEELPQELAAAQLAATETVQLQISLSALHELQQEDPEINSVRRQAQEDYFRLSRNRRKENLLRNDL